MKKILLLCALLAFVAMPAMAQGITKSYEDYKKYHQGNESYQQYKDRLDAHARANRVGELMERINDMTDGKLEEWANGSKNGSKKPNVTKKIYPVVQPEAIDLGLPSGTLWASMNLGAKAPEEVGNYYAYGETKAKAQFTLSNYAFYDTKTKCMTGVAYQQGDIAGTNADAAHVALEGHWRMPDGSQWNELWSKCKDEVVEVNNIQCHRLTGPNGNSILIPYNGEIEGSHEVFSDVSVSLWSSDVYLGVEKCRGMPVRPVNVDPALVAESQKNTAERNEIIKQQKIAEELDEYSVDLGIGVRWAKCNYGATRPTSAGHFVEKPYSINETKLPLSGYSSSMPSGDELKDLAEKCTWTETTEDGVLGYKVTGPNGNSIFIPCGGNKGGINLKGDAKNGCYLVSSKDGVVLGHRILIAKKGKVKLSWGMDGYNVREVFSK